MAGAATRDENRTACPAKLGSRCGRARWYTGDFRFRMKSQVQVLAGPPLFSQLRGLLLQGRPRSLPAWAAVGPQTLQAVEPKDLRIGRPRAQVHHLSPARGRRLRSSPGHGRPDGGNPAPDNLRAQPCRRGVHRAQTLFLDRRTVLASPACPGRPGGRAWPAARAPPRRRPGPARRRRRPNAVTAGTARRQTGRDP
jgi:hypothetical protein